MVWYFLSLLAAIATSAYFIFIKKFTDKLSLKLLAAGSFITTGLIMGVLSLSNGFPVLKPDFPIVVFTTAFLNFIANYLLYSALKKDEISVSIPMLSYAVLPTLLISFLLLGEFPSTSGFLGVFLISFGTYFIELKNVKHFLDPYKRLFSNKAVQYVLIVALLYGASSTFDKLNVLYSDSFFGGSVKWLLAGIMTSMFAIYSGDFKISEIKKHYKKFLIIGFLLALIEVSMNLSYLEAFVSYSISIKRLSILFAVLYSALVLKESNPVHRSIASLAMVAGAILIIIS